MTKMCRCYFGSPSSSSRGRSRRRRSGTSRTRGTRPGSVSTRRGTRPVRGRWRCERPGTASDRRAERRPPPGRRTPRTGSWYCWWCLCCCVAGIGAEPLGARGIASSRFRAAIRAGGWRANASALGFVPTIRQEKMTRTDPLSHFHCPWSDPSGSLADTARADRAGSPWCSPGTR